MRSAKSLEVCEAMISFSATISHPPIHIRYDFSKYCLLVSAAFGKSKPLLRGRSMISSASRIFLSPFVGPGNDLSSFLVHWIDWTFTEAVQGLCRMLPAMALRF